MKLPLIAQDKANHFIYGTAVAVVAKLVFPEFAFSGLVAAVLIGLAKEAADAALNYKATKNWKTGPHSVDYKDVIATALGGLSTIGF